MKAQVTMPTPDRSHLNFEKQAREAFAFLGDLGFSEAEVLPTLIRYQNDGIEVDVYHGRQSYEIGAGVTAFGIRYTMSEIIRAVDPEVAKRYRNPMATTQEVLAAGLAELGALMKRYGGAALRGDPQFFAMLGQHRKQWTEEYALDVLASQLRPQADEAFRRRDYARAAELYVRIQARLGPAEIKKLTLAKERSKR